MWQLRYSYHELLHEFEDEQDYIDTMFVILVMQNYGVWVSTENLYSDRDDMDIEWSSNT